MFGKEEKKTNADYPQPNPKAKASYSVEKDVNLIVVGPTGAGKSSLINLFYIWAQKIPVEKLAELKKVPIKTKYFDGDGTAEQNLQDEKKSCTTESRKYDFRLENPATGAVYNLQFLDTPGLGDTAGIQKDDENIDNICDTVAKTEMLNAILLVVNGTEARVHSRLEYLVKKLEGMIPDQLHSNLFVLMTNVDLKPNMKAEELHLHYTEFPSGSGLYTSF